MCQLKIRTLNENDYDNLVDWWNWHRFPTIEKRFLPENGLGGIMVQIDEIDVCAGFLYLTNSKIAWIEYLVSNPNYKNKDRKQAISMTIKRLCEIASELGYEAIFSSVKNQHLIKHFEEIGFSKDNTTEMTLKL